VRDIAAESIAATAIGATGTMRPDSRRGETIEAFESVESAANLLCQQGVILITSKHREQMSGRSLVDVIQFVRLR